MSLYGAEPIVTEVVNILANGLTSALAALETVDGVTVALTAPDASTGFWDHLTNPTLLPSYPAVMVRRGPRTVVGERSVNDGYQLDNELAVDVILTDPDPATLTLQMDRYVRAVCELLTAPRALTMGDCELVRVGYEEPQLTDRESGDTLQDVPCFFSVTTYETPPGT